MLIKYAGTPADDKIAINPRSKTERRARYYKELREETTRSPLHCAARPGKGDAIACSWPDGS